MHKLGKAVVRSQQVKWGGLVGAEEFSFWFPALLFCFVCFQQSSFNASHILFNSCCDHELMLQWQSQILDLLHLFAH